MNKKIDEVIIINRLNYSEYDRIVTVLGRESGKTTFFVKGARKPKSRMGSGVELMSCSEVAYLESQKELKTLVGANLKTYYGSIVEDYQKTQLVFDIFKKLSKLLDNGSGQEFYVTLHSLLYSLSDDNFDLGIVAIWIKLRILKISGVLGEIKSQGDGSKYRFDTESQAFIVDPGGAFGQNEIKLVRILSNHDKPIKINNDQVDLDKLNNLAESMFKFNIG